MLAEVVLTVSESKRLIAKGVAALPVVQKALAEGIVAVAPGSTNAYVVEELLGAPIEKQKYMTGATLPAGVGRQDLLSREVPDVVLRKGKPVADLSAVDAVKEMGAGDVFIKGANALHYASRRAGILIGDPTGGTVGAVIGAVIARRITLIVPVGLEKCVAQPIEDVYGFLSADPDQKDHVSSLWPVDACIVTEIEALRALTPVAVMQSGAGGLAGAEGAVRLVLKGDPGPVDQATALLRGIQGEPPFVRRD